jgi:hypothetical protein
MPDAGLDGRVITEVLAPEAVPPSATDPAVLALAAAFKRLNAPLGDFTRRALAVSTRAAFTAGTPEGAALDAALASLVYERDALAGAARTWLTGAVHGDGADPVLIARLTDDINELLDRVTRS